MKQAPEMWQRFRWLALIPAVVLGAGIVIYSQREAADTGKPLIRPEDPFAGTKQETTPHVVLITSKRVHMPVFRLEQVPWKGSDTNPVDVSARWWEQKVPWKLPDPNPTADLVKTAERAALRRLREPEKSSSQEQP